MEFNGMSVPDELQFDFEMGSLTDEQKTERLNSYFEANPDKKSGGEGGQPAGGGQQQQQQNNAGQFDYKKYGDDIENDEHLTAYINDGRQWRQKKQELDQMYNAVKEQSEILAAAKDPVPDKYKSQIQFFKNTGIDDATIAKNITSLTPESVKTDPISVLVSHKFLENKELAELGWDRVRRSVLKENGLSSDIEDISLLSEDEQAELQIKATSTMKSVQEKLEKFASNKDFYTSLQEERENTRKEIQERYDSWKPQVQNIVSEFSKGYTIKVKDEALGEIDIPVAISEGSAKQIIQHLGQYLATVNPDEKGVQGLRSAIVGGAIGNEKAAVELIQASIPLIKEKLQGIVLREIQQQIRNGKDPFIEVKNNPHASQKGAVSAGDMLDSYNNRK